MKDSVGTDLCCSSCNAPIPTSDVNIGEGVALCRTCNRLIKLGELMSGAGRASGDDIAQPPAGCRIEQIGSEHTVVASARNLGGAIFFCVFAVFWNSITSVFVLIAISGTVMQLAGSVPSWFPAPKMNGQPMSLGDVLFLWAFLTPFILVGIGTFFGAFFMLFGRIEVRLNGAFGTIFTGVRSLGWRRRFDASSVTAVRIVKNGWKSNNRDMQSIELAGKSPVKFGSGLDDSRRAWMARVLQSLLVSDAR